MIFVFSYQLRIKELMSFLKDLEEKGYCVINNVLSEEEVEISLNSFHELFNSYSQIKESHNKVSPHGIFKFFEVGHQRHAWFIRTRSSCLKYI